MIWRMGGVGERAIMAPPPDKDGVAQETCEFIHYSAHFRLRCPDKEKFSPFPYRPENLKTALNKNPGTVTALSALEKQYRP